MKTFTSLRSHLEVKNDLEWFDTMCDILRKDNHPTTRQIIQLIGSEKPNHNNEIRGSKFLIPFDSRFKWAAVNPDLLANDIDRPLDYFSVGGENFNLKINDVIDRFQNYRIQRNIYDGGTQIFFYPVPSNYEFSAIAFWTKREPEEIENITSLIIHSVTFKFGENLVLGRDGYHMKR